MSPPMLPTFVQFGGCMGKSRLEALLQTDSRKIQMKSRDLCLHSDYLLLHWSSISLRLPCAGWSINLSLMVQKKIPS